MQNAICNHISTDIGNFYNHLCVIQPDDAKAVDYIREEESSPEEEQITRPIDLSSGLRRRLT